MENLLSEGLELMVFGMGFVFVFLTLLIFTTAGMSKVVSKYFPEAPAKPKAKKAAPAAATASNDELIAVMTAAVHKYRS
ncbi:OadG family transporter subunit [Neptuniibacter pectenicola]|jgi:oxaloacetate decarboxylase gamma subunit|uniref:Probable oxaloacetate decarboxylase gamma chain n=1 Tax=Neptuniibacter pectenicola TaxID=1806669 RepID=A0ABU9TXF7_9GAMM|nr:OadG family transporter subunit [Neptuniibacter pectenicola]KXJ51003.1 MAG: oxaloacetate decarboxylase [Neptuniibacter sp. Phe_28]|tara:strand:- start:1452 stop:1688 length:237 start_codon:yes stop_codon:yes gene_type:complete